MDYEELIKKIIEKQTFAGGDGSHLAIKILDYLDTCPFIDIVSEELELPLMSLYNNLRYYLDQQDFDILLTDLKNRRKDLVNGLKKELIIKSRRYSKYYL